jgi:Uma2 family endonuclease
MRWTTADLDLLPDDGTRYEIIGGELLMTHSPHAYHQRTSFRVARELDAWSQTSHAGEVFEATGVLFSESDVVIPDVLWISHERLARLLDAAGHFTGAPELMVEVLSPGMQNERRDRALKLRLYEAYGVQEYWIVDWQLQQVTIYRREQGMLRLALTLLTGDALTSPLLPGFTCPVARLFA